MTDDQLLQELKKQKLLDEPTATRLQKEMLLSGRSAEQVIHERHIVPDEKIVELKSRLLKIPNQKINFSAFDNSLLEIIPEETVRTYGVTPFMKQGDTFIVGMLHPDDPKAQEALKFIAHRNNLNLGVYVISYGDWQEIVKKYSPYKTEVEAAVKALELKPGDVGPARRVVRLEEELARGAEEAPIIKIVTGTFKEAVESRASDVHIEPQENYLRIRLRIDGELREIASLPVELAQPVVSRVKVISNLKIDETRIPQDGRFRARIFDKDVDFRVSTFPTPLGEKVAIRVLDPSVGLKSFDQLGLIAANLEKAKNGLEKPFGMVLLTGPTGSGKTTTLYAFLQVLNKEAVNIVSLEDPVEYFVTGVNQSQVRPEIGYDFASGLRQILRQDPDVIMVGEIRDNETAGLAVQAALTGHIVLSTLHTNNAASVIPRLLDMKIEPFLLPMTLNLMIAQRLVGTLCPKCKKEEEAPSNIQEIISRALIGLGAELSGKHKKPYVIYHSFGCNFCKGKGVFGRTAMFEVLEMTEGLAETINTGPTLQKIVKETKAQGMITLRQDGVLKALAGIISIEEAIGNSEEM